MQYKKMIPTAMFSAIGYGGDNNCVHCRSVSVRLAHLF